jgi:DNA-binding MarR family transcriptional regulator
VSRWRPVFRLLSDMDDEIARVYADNGIADLKPTWVFEILRLHARGPMTIAELARSVGRTHSALSQKVAAMRTAGWLDTSAGPDARSKKVTLTPKAERVAALLDAEWRATEAAIAEVDSEIPRPLAEVAEDIRSALARKSLHDRITERLAADGSRPGRLAPAAASARTAAQAAGAGRIRARTIVMSSSRVSPRELASCAQAASRSRGGRARADRSARMPWSKGRVRVSTRPSVYRASVVPGRSRLRASP